MSTLTVSMAGKSLDAVILLQVFRKSMDLGTKGPQWPYVGPRFCHSLSLDSFLCEQEVQPHPHPHKYEGLTSRHVMLGAALPSSQTGDLSLSKKVTPDLPTSH